MTQENSGFQSVPTTFVVDAFPLADIQSPRPTPKVEAVRSVASHFMGGMLLAIARPRVLILLMGMSLLLPMVVAMPVFFSAEEHLQVVDAIPGGTPIDLPQMAPGWLLGEWTRAAASDFASTTQTIPALLLLVSLCNLFITAGWMRAALERKRAHSLHSFCSAGGFFFFPFLRTWILGLGLFAAATFVFFGPPMEWVLAWFVPQGNLLLAESERTSYWLEILRQVLYLAALWTLEIWLDLARASLVCGTRRSAFLGMCRGLGFLLRRPASVFGLMALGFGCELLWIAGTEALRGTFSWPLWIMLFLLPFGRIVLRGARIMGLTTYYEACTRESVAAEEEEAEGQGEATAEMAF